MTYREKMRIEDPKAAAYWDGRDALVNTPIARAEDIAFLPWHGNHASDNGLFQACEKFVRSTSDKEQQKLAIHNFVLYGMGEDEPLITDKQLEDYLAEKS
jgi:hypothetical protein